MLAMNRWGVGQAMAGLTVGNRPVGPLVAIKAVDAAVVGFGGGKIPRRLRMAHLTEAARDMAGGRDPQRRMGGMTGAAVGIGLVRQMGFMAVEAGGDLLVPAMAAGAIEFAMATGVLIHLATDLGVTGKAFQAHRLQGISQRDQRLVGIGVAVLAAVDLIMGEALVALVTGAKSVPGPGRMLRMAVKAADFGRMRSPGYLQRPHFFTVTLATIALFQFGRIGSNGTNAERGHQQEDSPLAA